jgi:aminoglycoside 6'-N-acetyltransferase I
MRIETATSATLEDWLELRQALWSWTEAEHRAEARAALANPDAIAFLARDDQGRTIGFAEATLRHDYVNGCTTSPVGFLEGIYVRQASRARGVARALVKAVEDWTLSRGCRELASDAWTDDTNSHAMHARLGFSETERVVYFRKSLDQPASLATRASDNS